MKLWTWVKDRVYRPAFFVGQSFTLKQGLKFYSGLIGVLVIAQIVIALPGTVRFVHEILSERWDHEVANVTALFPEELELTVKQGVVSTNVSEPYTLPIPIEWRTTEADMPENLLVIDTTRTISMSDFTRHDTWFILGEQSAGFYNAEKSEYRIYDLTRLLGRETFTVDESTYSNFVAQASHYLKLTILIGLCLMPFILYGWYFVGYLVYLILGAVVVLLVARYREYSLSYGRAYLTGLFLLPLPLGYHLLLSLFGVMGMPFAFTLVLIIATLVNFPKKSMPVPVATTEMEKGIE